MPKSVEWLKSRMAERASRPFAVPDDDLLLKRHHVGSSASLVDVQARAEYTNFFHCPEKGSYAQSINDPPANMSDVNSRIWAAFLEWYNAIPGVKLFRLSLRPVNPENDALNQDWIFEPLEKYKSRPEKSVVAKAELLTLPSEHRAVIYIRDQFSRNSFEGFLDSMKVQQEARTKHVAKHLTGTIPQSVTHAERLVDAAIDRKILQARLERTQPLVGFWSLPVEMRSRIYQLAAGADNQFWPTELETYNFIHPKSRDDYAGLPVMRGSHSLNGVDQALTLVRNVNSSPVGTAAAEILEQVCLTPALLSANSQMRSEAVQAIYNQAEFCFFQLSDLQHFLLNLKDDSIAALRKLRLEMPIKDLLTLFSLGRLGLSWDENTFLESLRTSLAYLDDYTNSYTGLKTRVRATTAKNDEIFSGIASAMRLTHLTVDMTSVGGHFATTDEGENPTFGQIPGSIIQLGANPHGFAPAGAVHSDVDMDRDAKLVHMARLLLSKLINLTLDFWKRENNSDRPQLHLIWSDKISPDQKKEFDLMSQHYLTIDVSQLLDW